MEPHHAYIWMFKLAFPNKWIVQANQVDLSFGLHAAPSSHRAFFSVMVGQRKGIAYQSKPRTTLDLEVEIQEVFENIPNELIYGRLLKKFPSDCASVSRMPKAISYC